MSTAPLAGIGEAAPLRPSRRTVPFDIAFRYDLKGEPGAVQRQAVTVSIEASFVAVSIGYGVVPKVETIRFGPRLPPPPGGPILVAVKSPSLRNLTLGDLIDGLSTAVDEGVPAGAIGPLAASVLSNGLRLADVTATSALLGGGTAQLDRSALGTLFQAVAVPADRIQFRYALFDDGTGREFQSEPILNIAGLGIADGGRPFRYFARPIRFAPRSSIRLEITEESAFVGVLQVSLQGYKVLGSASSPTGRAVRRAAGRGRARRRPRRL
jgi:hypothetical protein